MTNSKLSSFVLGACSGRSFYVANAKIKGDTNLTEHIERQDFYQQFAWFPEVIIFIPLGESTVYWIEVFIGDSYEVDPDADFALLLPFTNGMNEIVIGGSDRGDIVAIRNIQRGVYQLFYQERYLTQAEIDQIPAELPSEDPQPNFWNSFGPKICQLVFILTSTVPKPEILKPYKTREISTLFLHEKML